MQEEHQTEKEASGSLPGENTPEIGEAETSVRSEDAADKKSVWRRVIWPALKKFASRWFITGFGGMSQGLFATLIIGLIIKQLGKLIGEGTGVGQALILAGNVASVLTGAGIGAGIAHSLKANRLVIFACMVAGFIGAQAKAFAAGTLIENGNFVIASLSPGDPIGAFFAAVISAEIGILLTGKTKVDIIILPLCVILISVIVAYTICPPIIALMDLIGEGIQLATQAQPFLMGIIISAVVGLLLTLPTSSAAICLSINLGGLAGGAAVVGCAAHMVGFAVASFRENRWAGLIAQGLGTSMLQIPNLMRKPLILLPAVISSIVVGPLATCVFGIHCVPAGSGMGTSGLVGVFGVIEASSGLMSGWMIALAIALLFFILPAAISLAVSEFMRKKGWLTEKDMKLEL